MSKATAKPSSAELVSPTAVVHDGIRVGVGGWTFEPWRDNFYPAQWPQKRELEFASRKLSAIEVNGTFYGAQKPATYRKWGEETPDGFVFSLKAPRYCTNRRVLAEAGKTIDAFVYGGIAELGDRLGPILWQFEPHHGFDRDDFARFLDLLPHEVDGAPLRHVLEVRNPDFLCDAFIDLAREHRRPTVFTDSEEHPSFADVTGDFVYARLMRSHSDIADGYKPKALDAWAERARTWAAGGEPGDLPRVQADAPRKKAKRRDVFVYFINAAKERNPAAAMALLRRLAQKR